MVNFFLILSIILLISTFGIHATISNGKEINKPMYVYNPYLKSIPIICGFILPVFAWTKLLSIHWILLFFINLAVVWVIGPILTREFLVRFASEKGFGYDMIITLISGTVALIIGLVL
jgi:hypothetical protein